MKERESKRMERRRSMERKERIEMCRKIVSQIVMKCLPKKCFLPIKIRPNSLSCEQNKEKTCYFQHLRTTVWKERWRSLLS